MGNCCLNNKWFYILCDFIDFKVELVYILRCFLIYFYKWYFFLRLKINVCVCVILYVSDLI